MTFRENFEKLKMQVDTLLKKNTIDALNVLIIEYTKSVTGKVNDQLLSSGTATVHYDMKFDNYYIICGNVKCLVNVPDIENITPKIHIKRIVEENIIQICNKTLKKHFDGMFITKGSWPSDDVHVYYDICLQKTPDYEFIEFLE